MTLFFIISFALSPYSQLVYAPPGPTSPRKTVTVFDSKTGAFNTGSDPFFNNCPNEVYILVHGWSPSEQSAREDFNRAAMSMDAIGGVDGPRVGFLWPSQTPIFTTAKENAINAGNVLAKYLIESKPKCGSVPKIHIAAHSMGSIVVASALQQLASNPVWNNNHYKVDKIFFLGSPMDSKSPDITSPFGKSIQNSVLHFYNLFSPSDKIKNLVPAGPTGVKGEILGVNGANPSITKPTNYADKNVASLIIINNDANGDGACDIKKDPTKLSDDTNCVPITKVGENHLGYWGFLDTGKHLINTGPISLVTSLIKTP